MSEKPACLPSAFVGAKRYPALLVRGVGQDSRHEKEKESLSRLPEDFWCEYALLHGSAAKRSASVVSKRRSQYDEKKPVMTLLRCLPRRPGPKLRERTLNSSCHVSVLRMRLAALTCFLAYVEMLRSFRKRTALPAKCSLKLSCCCRNVSQPWTVQQRLEKWKENDSLL